MKPQPSSHFSRERGSLLIIVLWIAFGLVSITLYFANSMSMELRAADNRVASIEAEEAIEGGAVYVSNILATLAQPGMIPSTQNYRADGVKVGGGMFWLIGRDTNDVQTAQPDQMVFGLVDEASKVNLNTANLNMLTNLPQMTENPNIAAAIYDWRTTNTTPSQNGAKSQTYSMMQPPYLCKMTNFESVDELRLVYGMNMDLLYGEDANLNGILDPNENDGDTLPPHDNQDGRLDPGLLEYVTVCTHEPTVTSNGTGRVLVNAAAVPMRNFLTTNLDATKANLYVTRAGGSDSLLQFYVKSDMSAADFMQVEMGLMNTNVQGLINVNTATETALACIPGIGIDGAATVLSYRQSNPTVLTSVAWLKDALSLASNPGLATIIGPYVTGHSYQLSADIAAVGHNGRGYRRVKFIFDLSSGIPQIIYRQDLTHLGWALGAKVRQQLLAQAK